MKKNSNLNSNDNYYIKPATPELPKSFEEKNYSPSGIVPPFSILIIFVSGILASSVIVAAILPLQWVTMMYLIKPMNIGSASGVLGLIFIVIYGFIGAVGSSYATHIGSKFGKNRNPKVISAIGFISAYAGCLLGFFLTNRLFLTGESQWKMVFIGGMAGLFYAGVVSLVSYFMSKDDTFCEKCNGWYSKSKTIHLDVNAAEDLIRALENINDNKIILKDYQLDNKEKRRLDISIQNCPHCDEADYRISASIHWQEKNAKKEVESKYEDYFDIIANQYIGKHILKLLFS